MKCTRGSALLFVVLSLAIVTLYMTGLIRTASLSIDFASYRTDYIKRQYMLDGLCEYATAWALDNFDSLFDELAITEHVKKAIRCPLPLKDMPPRVMLRITRKEDLLLLDLSEKKEIQETNVRAWSIQKKSIGSDVVHFYIKKYVLKKA